MTNDRLGWYFGFVLLFGLFGLALIFGIKRIEEATSFGLKEVLEILKNLIIFWAGWKFNDRKENTKGE
jgi:hypothetical protein